LAKRDARRELEELDEVFTCLAHASRRQILLSLRHHGGAMTAGEIASRFGCSWPTTSRHLKQLEAAGLVAVETRGRERSYELVSERLSRVVGGWIERFGA
jgi:DNA-binding transcriptional ArsR family regulator